MSGRLVIRLSDPTTPSFAGVRTELDEVDDLVGLRSSVGPMLGTELQDLLAALDDPHGLRTARFVRRSLVAPADLRSLETSAWARFPRSGRTSLTRYWIVEADGLTESQLRAVQRRLAGLPIVDLSLREPGLAEPTVNHLDEYYGEQGYLKPGPKGIGVEAAWDAGFSGGETRIVDVERGWLYDHQDLPVLTAPQPVNPPLNSSTNTPIQGHGTKVLGVLAAIDGPPQSGGNKPPGIVGIAPHIGSAGLLTSSRFESLGDDKYLADAVLAAADKLEPGDILLLEVQLDIYMNHEPHLLPLELFEPYWNLIRTVVDMDIVVIEPAGNGGRNLDVAATDQQLLDYFEGDSKWKSAANTVDYGVGLMELDRSKTGFEDSGAIMVAACVPDSFTDSEGNVATKDTNYGRRVDCYAWGSGVYTTANKHFADSVDAASTPADQSYTDDFGGTSAASAIVAGAGVLVQDMHKEYRGEYALPEVLRDLLRDPETGTAHSGAKPIGIMPDLGPIHQGLKCRNATGWRRFKCWIRRIMDCLARLFGWW